MYTAWYNTAVMGVVCDSAVERAAHSGRGHSPLLVLTVDDWRLRVDDAGDGEVNVEEEEEVWRGCTATLLLVVVLLVLLLEGAAVMGCCRASTDTAWTTNCRSPMRSLMTERREDRYCWVEAAEAAEDREEEGKEEEEEEGEEVVEVEETLVVPATEAPLVLRPLKRRPSVVVVASDEWKVSDRRGGSERAGPSTAATPERAVEPLW